MRMKHLKHLTDFAKSDDPGTEEFSVTIPEDLTTLSDEDLTALHADAVEAFRGLYGEGADFSDEDLTVLSDLADGIEALAAEVTSRQALAAERAEKAAALAAKVDSEFAVAEVVEAAEDEPLSVGDTVEITAKEAGESASSEEEEPTVPEAVTAAAADGAPARRAVSLSGVRRRAPRAPQGKGRTIKDVLSVADVPGFKPGEGVDFNDLARAVERRLQGMNAGAYSAAASAGRHLREQHGLAVLRREFAPEVTVTGSDDVNEAIRNAVDESRLPGGSLVASGGWCAPSETVYDLMEEESRDGLLSLPEVNVTRGGLKFTAGPAFSDLFSKMGFNYTEEDDKAGKYSPTSESDPTLKVGPKPCYRVPCPTFEEARLDAGGVCISAGLLQQRGYPELIARTVRGALVVHDHKQSERYIAAMEKKSTAVSLATGQVGATAPILTAVDLQVEHYRYVNRLSRSKSLEIVLPFWVRGVIRSDLARRLGVDLLDVTDARVDAWFRTRGVNPQYVYDWQALTGTADTFKAWPATLKFLIYSAGTFVKGASDVLTIDTVYDSTLLAKNDYTALFTEEGWFVAKFGHDARAVTVPLDPSGHTAGGVAIKPDGTLKA